MSNIYVGQAVSSLSIILIQNFGWRGDFMITGAIGGGLSVLCLILVREPKKGQYDYVIVTDSEEIDGYGEESSEANDEEQEESGFFRKLANGFRELFSNPVSRYCVIGGSFRYFGGLAIAYYMPLFFLRNYPKYNTQFSLINGAMASILGFLSSLTGGLMSDRFNKENPMTKAYITMASGFLSAPFIFLTFYFENFWLCITMLGFNYIFAEAWGSPSMTMLLDSASPKNAGFTISAYLSFCTLSGMLSTVFLDYLNQHLGAEEDTRIYGVTLRYVCTVSYLGSVPFFWLAGRGIK